MKNRIQLIENRDFSASKISVFVTKFAIIFCWILVIPVIIWRIFDCHLSKFENREIINVFDNLSKIINYSSFFEKHLKNWVIVNIELSFVYNSNATKSKIVIFSLDIFFNWWRILFRFLLENTAKESIIVNLMNWKSNMKRNCRK